MPSDNSRSMSDQSIQRERIRRRILLRANDRLSKIYELNGSEVPMNGFESLPSDIMDNVRHDPSPAVEVPDVDIVRKPTFVFNRNVFRFFMFLVVLFGLFSEVSINTPGKSLAVTLLVFTLACKADGKECSVSSWRQLVQTSLIGLKAYRDCVFSAVLAVALWSALKETGFVKFSNGIYMA